MKFENMKDLIGQTVYVLRVVQLPSYNFKSYSYQIYPAELKIQEIRFGDARRQDDAKFYGPGFVTLLCQHEKGYVQAFSPVGDEILSKSCTAGRNTRAFFNKDDLYHEAEILKECVLKHYSHVNKVEIVLPKRSAGLDERVQEACVRAKDVFSSDGVEEKERYL